MRRKLILKTVIILMLASAIGMMTFSVLSNDKDNDIVFVATRDIEMFSVITNSDVKMISINKKSKDVFFSSAFKSKQDIIGRVTTQSISKDDVFITSMSLIKDSEERDVIKDNGEVNISEFVQEDERIGFISIDLKNSLGGMVEKGDYIDIIYTSQTNETGGLYTEVLLQKLLVYQVSKNKNSSSMLDVHFVLNADQSKKLILAKYTGHIDFLLTKETAKEYEGIATLPNNLYESLTKNGYVLQGEKTEVNNEMSGNQIQQEILEAEKKLSEAIEAMKTAKSAMAEKEDSSLEDVVKSLEKAVKDLEISVDRNSKLLEKMEKDNE